MIASRQISCGSQSSSSTGANTLPTSAATPKTAERRSSHQTFFSVGSPSRVLRRRDRARFDAALAAADCAILAYWTGPTLRRPGGDWNMLHTVAVQRIPGGVEVSNVDVDRPRPWRARSVAEFLKVCGGEPVCLFALK